MHDEILDQVADFIVNKCSADSGFQAEAFAEATGDVVLAAAFPCLEPACCANAPFARVKPQHDFAERKLIESEFIAQFEWHIKTPVITGSWVKSAIQYKKTF